MPMLNAIARRILPAGGLRRVADVICHERVGRGLARVFRDRIPSGGLRVRTDHPRISPRTKAEIFWGIYESAEIRFVRAHLRRDLDVLELGASLGVVSCHIARNAGPGRRIACVEANPELIDVIRANLAEAAPDRDARVIHRAIDYQSGRSRVPLTLGETTDATRVGVDEPAGEGAASAPTSTLSGLLGELSMERYALVCDIEGSESGIIFEDERALSGCEQIIAELHDTRWHGRVVRSTDLLEALCSQHGFRSIASHGKVWALSR